MTNVDDEYMAIDPEVEKIWREDEDPSFTELRSLLSEDENTVDEEPEDSDLEQPEDTEDAEESNDPISTEEDEEVEEEVQPEKDTTKPNTTTEDKVQETSTHRIKANGMEFDFTTDELKALAPKAMDYTRKMTEIAPWRKTISALKEQGLGESDVNLMIDVLKGDKDAISEVLKRTKIDPFDLSVEDKSNYVPNSYGKDNTALAIEDVINDISSDVEYASTVKVVDEIWDDASRNILAENPSLIKGLHNDIREGIYSKVAPMAEKLRVLDGGSKSALDYYVEAGRQYFMQQQQTQTAVVPMKEVKVSDTRQTEIKEMANKRKAASTTKASTSKRDIIDYLDDNDEEYEDWYKRTMSSR